MPGFAAMGLLLLVILATTLLALVRSLQQKRRLLKQLKAGLERLAQADYTVTLEENPEASLNKLVQSFNALGVALRERQRSAEQSDQLRYTLMDNAPMAILLLEDSGNIEFANQSARELFFSGQGMTGTNFLSLLADAPSALRDAVLDAEDRLFTVDVEGTTETYHLSKRHFELQGKARTLLMVKHLTREVRRQEIDIWKKLIRVLSHELNNSLAPITSLVHSARLITKPEPAGKLERVFCTIEERAHHLQGFVEGYAKFARLPQPRREHVNIEDFLRHIESLAPYARIDCHAETVMAYFDRSQLEQVMINLLKNAQEAGGPLESIALSTTVASNGVTRFVVSDRGLGMSAQVLENAMLPFYSTKERGTGLGLALCREIVEAHGGSIRVENRPEGGVSVTCELPGHEPPPKSAAAKLTLSRL